MQLQQAQMELARSHTDAEAAQRSAALIKEQLKSKSASALSAAEYVATPPSPHPLTTLYYHGSGPPC